MFFIYITDPQGVVLADRSPPDKPATISNPRQAFLVPIQVCALG